MTPSLRKAINLKCQECIYDPGCGGGPWRMQVEACTSLTCPLYPVKPKAQFRDKTAAERGSPLPYPTLPLFDGNLTSKPGLDGHTADKSGVAHG